MEIHPLTPDRWNDLETLFGKQGAWYGCWCMWWRLAGKDFEALPPQQRRNALREIVEAGHEPGLLAYSGEKPIGWCSVAPRREFARISPRARVYKPMDDEPAWSILCFYIHAKHRGQGVAKALLNAAIPFAAERGAPMLEGYPRIAEAPANDGSLFVGTLSMFLDAGFEEVARVQPYRAYVRRKL